ncbi:MAG: TIM barrel protein, partial [Planctomycetia bacterium]|nr:TIM barrel protein [Planctomycetia bacterium]
DALKKLDWQVSVAAYSFRNFTFFETVDRIAALGVKAIEGFNFQNIGGDMPGKLDPAAMTDEQIQKVQAKLDAAGMKLVALYYGGFPADEAASRRVFERCKKLGVRYFVSEPNPKLLPMLDKLAKEYDMYLGLHGHSKQSSPATWHPELVSKLCEPFSPHLGAFSDTGHWIRSELVPAEGVEILKDHFIGVEIHDLHAFNATGHDVPLGKGVGQMDKFLKTLAKVKKGPVLISIEYVSNPASPDDDVRECIRFIEKTAMEIAF